MSWLDLEPPPCCPPTPRATSRSCCGWTTPGPGSGRFLVIAPGAARVQLLSTSPNAYPVSKVTTTRPGGVAVVEVVNADDAAALPAGAPRRRRAPARRRGAAPQPRPARPVARGAEVPCHDRHRRGGLPRLRGRPLGRARAAGAPRHPRRTGRPPGHDRRAGRPARAVGAPARRGVTGCAARRRGARRGRSPRPRTARRAARRRPATRPGPPRREAEAASDDLASPPCCRCCAAPPRSSGPSLARRHGLGPGPRPGRRPARDAARRPLVDADAAVRGRLLAAHTAARAAAGWEPAEWALDRDLDDALDLLLAGPGDPPDAVALVGERHRQVRRRSVVLGAGAALAAAAVGRLGRAGGHDGGVVAGRTSTTRARRPGLGDGEQLAGPRRARDRRRGRRPGGRRLAAGAPALGRRPGRPAGRRRGNGRRERARGHPGAHVGGAARRRPGSLAPVGLVRDRVTFRTTSSRSPSRPGPTTGRGPGAVLLLARPAVLEARYSPLVAYGAQRRGRPQLDRGALRDGVATVPLRGPLPPPSGCASTATTAARSVRHRSGSPAPSPSGPLAESLLAALGPFVAACTGLPASAVRSRIALEAAVPGDVLVQAARGRRRPAAGRVVVAHTDLPERRAAAQRPGRRRRPR